MKLQNPWPEGYSINKNSPFGYRIHPISGKKKFHNGVDVAGSFPVTAAADGVVSKVGWAPTGGGHTVLIDHGDIVTVYYHGAHKTALRKGQRVHAGDFIYTSGTTGASTGNHLHFEVRRRGGRWGNTLDESFEGERSDREQHRGGATASHVDVATDRVESWYAPTAAKASSRALGRSDRITHRCELQNGGVKANRRALRVLRCSAMAGKACLQHGIQCVGLTFDLRIDRPERRG